VRCASLLVAVGLVVASSSPAAAEDRWYGWQTLTADTVGGLVVANAVRREVDIELAFGMGVYLAAAPIIHHINGETRAAWVSFGARLGAPIVIGIGTALAVSTRSCNGPYCVLASLVYGGGAAVATMIVVALVDGAVAVAEDDDGTEARMLSIGGRF
jgi:hypothetical protein